MLFKLDHARRIDLIIDYFGGYPRARRLRIVPTRRARLLSALAVVPPRGRLAARAVVGTGRRPRAIAEWT